MTGLGRLASRLAPLAGDDERAAEIRANVADLEDGATGLSVADVASIAGLAARNLARRGARDVPWWLAGSAFAFLLLLLFAMSYESHFFAWDMIERSPDSAEARFWKRAVDVIVVIGVIAGLVAGRRAVQHVRRGRVLAPIGLFILIMSAATQSDLFVEHTPNLRDGRLREEHINEVPFYSVGLFAAFALIPVLFLLLDWLVTRRAGPRRAEMTMTPGPIDARALIAVGLPLTMFVVPFLWAVPFLFLVWSARTFGLGDKIAATAAIGVPLAALVGWAVLVDDAIDDISTPLLVAVLAVQGAVWARLAYLAMRPLPGLRVTTASS